MLLLDRTAPTRVSSEVFTRVWRTTLDQPGFAVVRFTEPVDSRELRHAMVSLVEAFPVKFVPERFGRFDQQVSSKFHRDGAPSASLLVLGYEPTTVRSRFWIADASAAATAEGLTLNAYLAAFNPMFTVGEAKLAPFITEVQLPWGEPFIVVINNSQLPLDPTARNPLGVLHKAIIDEPDPTVHRVINSIGLTPAANATGLPAAEIERFLTRDDLD